MNKTLQRFRKLLSIRCFAGLTISLIFCVYSANGHEIYLKNGKIINTKTIQEHEGKVVYGVKGGTVSISKDLVLKIVYDKPSQAPLPQRDTDGLIAYYAFNGNARDNMSASNQSSVYGAQLVADRFGTLDSAYFFDGVNDVIQLSIPVVASAPFSIVLWFNVYDLPQEGQYLFGNGGESDESQGIYCKIMGKHDISHGKSQWPKSGIQCGVRDANQQFFAIVTKETLATEMWHHVVFTWDGVPEAAHIFLYLDGQGVSVLKETGTFSSRNGPHNMQIGASGSSGVSGYFNGQIDDVRFYNRILSSAEISQLSQDTRPRSAPEIFSDDE